MSRYLYFMSLIIVIFWGTGSKELPTSTTDQCEKTIDTLSMILEHWRCGVYSVDWDYFPMEKYEKLSDRELVERNLPYPRDEDNFKIYEFNKYVEKLENNTECFCEWDKNLLVKKIGIPYHTYGNNFFYMLSFGPKCPSPGSIGSVFRRCTALVFKFEKNNCIDRIKY